MNSWLRAALQGICVVSLVGCATNVGGQDRNAIDALSIRSLEDLSIEALRKRNYSSQLVLESVLGSGSGGTEYSDRYSETGSGPYETYMASYKSDGLRIYTRIDLPNSKPPADGYPVIVFCHGWVGIEAAPQFHFSYTPASMYAEMIDGYVDAGFVVLTPGYRGHGTVEGVPADGIEYMSSWDNATYLAPTYYAIDVLNLIAGLDTIEEIAFASAPDAQKRKIDIDLSRIFLSGHSQGGDVVLTALAIAGEESDFTANIAAASISDGTFAPRLEQLEFYSAMQGTRRSFLSGDGSWTGTAVGADGEVNADFRFGYPPDWIETPHPSDWTWQGDRWPDIPVSAAIELRTGELYEKLSAQVVDLAGANFSTTPGADGRPTLAHDERVSRGMSAIGGYDRPQYLSEPLLLHYSDQDFYSPPDWNLELCRKVNALEGNCAAFLYSGNSHLMRASDYEWFSPPGTKDSYRTILARDIRLFLGLNPADIAYP